MKYTSIVVLLATCTFVPADGFGNQNAEAYFAPVVSRRVTLSRNGIVVSSMVLPVGMFLSVTHDGQHVPSPDGRAEFHGNMTIKVQPKDNAPAQPPAGQRADFIMSAAPMVLTLTGMDVLIETDR